VGQACEIIPACLAFANVGIRSSDERLLSLEHFVDRTIRHHRLGQVFVAEMLLHQVFVFGGVGVIMRPGRSLISGIEFMVSNFGVNQSLLRALVGRGKRVGLTGITRRLNENKIAS